MPRSRSILGREGFVLDPMLLLIRRVIINPFLLLPAVIALDRVPQLQPFIAGREIWVKRLHYLLYFGLLERVNAFLSQKALNNWTSDKWNWDEEIIVITGGSGGIGEGVVKCLCEEFKQKEKKCKVVVMDIMPLAYEAPPNVTYVKVDLSNSSEIAKAAEHIRTTVGDPTVLINNAGVCRGKSIMEASEKDIRLVLDVNTLAHFFLVKEFLPAMIKKNHGHILTVASVAAYIQAPRLVDYSVSKAATLSFHEGLSLELKLLENAPKIRTSVITQGFVHTPLFQGFHNNHTFLLPALQMETVAEAIADQILSGKSGHIVLPRAYNIVSGIRGWFSWLQRGMLAETGSTMSKWHGRQVKDPNAC